MGGDGVKTPALSEGAREAPRCAAGSHVHYSREARKTEFYVNSSKF